MRLIINIIIGVVLLFVANTVVLALAPGMASVERGYVDTTSGWGDSLRAQVSSVNGGR